MNEEYIRYYLFRHHNMLPSVFEVLGEHEKDVLRVFVFQALQDDLKDKYERPTLF